VRSAPTGSATAQRCRGRPARTGRVISGGLAPPAASAASSDAGIDPPELIPMAYQDILYDKRDGIATITINRPTVLNAFRADTVEEMLDAMRDAEEDEDIGVVVLAGAGDRAFCSGGDNSARASGPPSEKGYGGRRLGGLPTEALRGVIRDSDNIRGIGALGFEALALYYNSEESKEGTAAFLEKRRPDFRKRKRS